jgi:hypothetical protein
VPQKVLKLLLEALKFQSERQAANRQRLVTFVWHTHLKLGNS